MIKQAVRPAAVERGRAVELAPRVPEPREWLVERFDWESTVTVIDMFSGAGGMSLGFNSVPGMAVVEAFKQDGRAAETHAANIAGALFNVQGPERQDELDLILPLRYYERHAALAWRTITLSGAPDRARMFARNALSKKTREYWPLSHGVDLQF